jgi:hypothetical protein
VRGEGNQGGYEPEIQWLRLYAHVLGYGHIEGTRIPHTGFPLSTRASLFSLAKCARCCSVVAQRWGVSGNV